MSDKNIIPANSDKPCACCNRIHRKLFLIDGLWFGKNCAEDYKLYKIDSNIKSLYWRGYESKHAKISKMMTARNGQPVK